MRQEDWDASKFVNCLVVGDGTLLEMLADLTADQLAEIDLIFAECESRE
jgi:hypothetical protein